MITISASSGFNSFFSKCTDELPLSSSDTAPFSSKRRCIVFASKPVASVIRFAARPVGAAKKISSPSSSKYRIIILIVVVFPVPGPPDKIKIPFSTASITAFLCSASSSIRFVFSNFFSFSASLSRCVFVSRSARWSSALPNARCSSKSILAQFSSA